MRGWSMAPDWALSRSMTKACPRNARHHPQRQFVGYMTSRETAAQIGQPRSNGTMRADGWSRFPLIRMTNVSLLPGSKHSTRYCDTDGIYMETNRSWSIDDKRYNFQFGCEIAWEIKGGKRVRCSKTRPTAASRPSSGMLRRDRRPGPLDAMGRSQLRQGPARAGNGNGTRSQPVAIPRDQDRQRANRLAMNESELLPRETLLRNSSLAVASGSPRGVTEVEIIFAAPPPNRSPVSRITTIHQNVSERATAFPSDDRTSRTARASTNRLHRDGIQAAVDEAIALARASEPP